MNPAMLMQDQDEPEMMDNEQEERQESCASCKHHEAKSEDYGVCHLISGAKEPPLVTAKGMLITPMDFYCSSYEPLEEEEEPPSPEEIEAILMGLKGE